MQQAIVKGHSFSLIKRYSYDPGAKDEIASDTANPSLKTRNRDPVLRNSWAKQIIRLSKAYKAHVSFTHPCTLSFTPRARTDVFRACLDHSPCRLWGALTGAHDPCSRGSYATSSSVHASASIALHDP